MLELTRYVVLNPLRTRMVDTLEDWRWSSFRSVIGLEAVPRWLDTDWLLGQFAAERNAARRRYRQFVLAGAGLPSPLLQTRHQLLLGDDGFVDRHRSAQAPNADLLREVSKAHRRSLALPLDEYRSRHPDRDQAMALAYRSGAFSMAEIGKHFAVHYMTVSRAVRKYEARQTATDVLECWT